MRRLVLAAAVSLAAAGCSRGFTAEQANGDHKATVLVERYPLALGRNELTLEVTDRNGSSLPADASVEVRYGLPPMPGMAPATESVTPWRDGERYAFAADVHTRASWTFDVVVRRPGRRDSTLTFRLDAP